MPIFPIPDDETVNFRKDPKVFGFDFTGEEELFALNDRATEFHKQVVERAKRINAWVDELGIERQMKERLQAAMTKASSYGAVQAMKAMSEDREVEMSEFLDKQDPILLSTHMKKWSSLFPQVSKEIDNLMDYAVVTLPESREQYRKTVLELVKSSLISSLAYDTMIMRFLERIEHGVPDWDFEEGCEMKGDPSVPTMNGYTRATETAKVEQQQADDQVANRLLSSMGDIFVI